MKDKKIIIAIIILVLVIVGTVLALYLKTDMFKSNEELFWKYLSKNTEVIELLKQEETLTNKSYTSSTNMSINTSITNENDQDWLKILKNLNDSNIKVTRSHDVENQKDLINISMDAKEENLFNLNLLKDNNIYAFKSKDIADGYIGIENNNIQELIQKIGVSQNIITQENIKINNYKELLTLAPEEETYLLNTYQKIIRESINKNKYTKNKEQKITVNEKSYIADSYTLTLSEKEFMQLQINILEKLAQDSQTLNLIATKLKSLNLTEEYASINSLNKKVSAIVEELKSKEYSNEEYLKIRVYVCDGKTIRTDITINKEDITYVIEENKEEQWAKIYKKAPDGYKYQLSDGITQIYLKSYSISNENTKELQIQFGNNEEVNIKKSKTKKENGYDNNFSIRYKGNIGNIDVYGAENIILENVDKIEDIEKNKVILLNKLDSKQVTKLVEAITSRITKIYEEKLQKVLTL